MNKRNGGGDDGEPRPREFKKSGDWQPNPDRIEVEPDPSGVGAMHLRHARYPFQATVAEDLGQDELQKELFRIATAYLRSANALLKLPDTWIPSSQHVNAPTSLRVEWLPFGKDLRGSYWLERFEEPLRRTGPIDRIAVLMASLSFFVPEKSGGPFRFPLFGGQGLHVTAHLDTPAEGPIGVRITSVMSSLPRLGSALHSEGVAHLGALLDVSFDENQQPKFNLLIEFVKQMSGLFGLAPNTVSIELGVRVLLDVDQSLRLELVSKTAPPVAEESAEASAPWMRESSYHVAARVVGGEFQPVAKLPLIAHANADADVFERDPVTQGGPRVYKTTRPHRPSEAFANYVDTVALWNAKPAPNHKVLLEDTTGYVRVLVSPLAKDPKPYTDTKVVPEHVRAEARTNDFAAVNAYVRATDFIGRLLSCGMNPTTTLPYLRFPLEIQYRGGIHPGGAGGKTVNAQVRWLSPPSDIPGAAVPGTAEVSFALADLRLNPARVPLGIAADARWAWHEWSHVMLAGATGMLEFAFAHSAGDALAAIVMDPDSALSGFPAWRGNTFPWVTLPDRRHDREAADGWSWAGSMYQHEQYFAPSRHVSDKKPYWSEQIHSSSLFRLYRALGGDTAKEHAGHVVPDRDLRGATSEFAIYLILRAISLMGSASTHPVQTPGEFVTHLTNADGPSPFSTSERLFIGGAAGKVIRWAYQRQGLYPDPNATYPVDAPGLPRDVDVYIENRAGRLGGYEPLRYFDGDWHASPQRMLVTKTQNSQQAVAKPKAGDKAFLKVYLNNCGSKQSDDVTVNAWVAQVNSGGQIPGWRSASWQALTQVTSPANPVVDPDSAGGNPAGPWIFEWTPAAQGKRYALLAEATSAADPSNIDTTTGLPCATVTVGGVDASDMPYLVSCDNNLGLIVVRT